MSDRFHNLFYDPAYIHIQEHAEVRTFEDNCFKIVFAIEDGIAKSLPRGLFGSIERKTEGSFDEFQEFVLDVIRTLRKESVKKIEVVVPPDFYDGWISLEWMKQLGFSEKYVEINHHVELSNFKLHSMEQRKLDKLAASDIEIIELSKDHLEEAYDFLKICREEKGLELNISLDKLSHLFAQFPGRYSIFGSYRRGKMTSAVIVVRITEEVVYYYLPGTMEAFKKESPMVGLIEHLVGHYKSTAKYLDLGVSSIQGKRQEGLISFKERVGGVRRKKIKFQFQLK